MFEKFYQLQQDTLSPEDLEKTLQHTLQHPLLGKSVLSKAFMGTRGFSVVWKASSRGEAELSRRYSWLAPYLKAVIKPGTNAWYLNALIVQKGGDIGAHKDQSLSPYLKKATYPEWVSVLCLQAPQPSPGGTLELYWEGVKLTEIAPTQNQLTHFIGDLDHLVTQYDGHNPRITLVCEQYKLEEELLKLVPEWAELSRGSTTNEEMSQSHSERSTSPSTYS